MRLWTLHPCYLDRAGLTALWREGLLAQKVLLGGTRGYRHHPQLQRFREAADPPATVAAYLLAVQAEATRRGYRFDAARIVTPPAAIQLLANEGQLRYEWQHLAAKLAVRAPEQYRRQLAVDLPRPHPLFRVQPGPVADWERLR